MGFVDIVLIALIVGGALYLLYRSLWKKRGYCPGCTPSGKCEPEARGSRPKSAVLPASKGG